MNPPLISIIIINWNGLEHLKECLESIFNQVYKNFEIIFVDNNSRDQSVNFVEKNYEDVKIVKLNRNYGFAKANNIGAKYANGDYIVLLNNDVIVDKKWLLELVKAANYSEKIGIVGSKIYYYDQRELINYAGGSFEKYGYSRHIGAKLKDNRLLNKIKKTFFVCGASLLIKKKVYQEIGLFDPLYFAYCEDLDLCWRTWLFGYKVIYTPHSFIFHKVGSVMEKDTKGRLYLNERNRLRTLLKNYQFKSFLTIIPVYIKRRFFKIKKNLFKDSSKSLLYLRVYIKSILWNILNLNSLIYEKKFISKNRKKKDKFIFVLMKQLTTFKNYINNIYK